MTVNTLIDDYSLEEAYKPKPDKLEPWQLWICTIPNEHVSDPESPKKRPVIIVQPYYDEEDLTDEYSHYPEDDYYPDIIRGTSEVDKYKDRLGVLYLDEQKAKSLGLNKATCFLVYKLIEYIKRGVESTLSAKEIYDNGGYLGMLDQNTIDNIIHIIGDNPVYKNNNIAVENLNEDVKELYSEKVKNFINDIYELRKDSIAKEGEFGLGNLVFKEFRNLGYLDSLKELRKQLKGQELSLEHLQENVVCETIIKSNTPYMLRNDGALLECGFAHPYIKIYQEYDYTKNLKELLKHQEYLDWFKENSKNERTLELLDKFEVVEDKASKEAEEIFNELHKLTSDEFCKVRTSNIKYAYGGDNGEIYFRISSENFNWFDLIWNVVFNNKDLIKYVTVVKDKPFVGQEQEYYTIEDKKLYHIPVEEFLTLKGNPILEKLVDSITMNQYNNTEVENMENLHEEMIKSNSKRLMKLLKAKPGQLVSIISSDVGKRNIVNKKRYENAKEVIETIGTEAVGMWKNKEQPHSYILKCSKSLADRLASNLCQLEIITILFDSDDSFIAKVCATDDNYKTYKEIESTNKVVFDDVAKTLKGYTIVDGVAFSLALYDTDSDEVFSSKNLTE